MAWSTYLMGGVGGVGALLAFCAVALPSSRRVERSGFVPAAPEQVFQLLSSTEGFQSFNPYKDEEPDLKITPFGPRAGVGAGFGFEGKSTTGTQTILAMEANRLVTMEIDLGAMGKPIQTFAVSADNGGSRVVWSTHSAFGFNPIARIFGFFLDGMLGPTYERGLANLAKVAARPS